MTMVKKDYMAWSTQEGKVVDDDTVTLELEVASGSCRYMMNTDD